MGDEVHRKHEQEGLEVGPHRFYRPGRCGEAEQGEVANLYGSEALAVPGVLPKGAVKMVGEMQFECTDRAMAQAIRELSAVNKCLVLWAMRHDPIKHQVVPVGLAVVTSGQLLLPAQGKVLLE